MLYPVWTAGAAEVVRRSLLPLDVKVPVADGGPPPLTNLPPAELMARLAQEYIFALVCEATVEAFVAENEARAATMATAKTNIDGKLAALEAEERRTRQEEITAEVVELAASARVGGARASG
jgi:F-type H+-transporting ATPase subunit gamma